MYNNKHVYKLFEVVCSHHHAAIAFYCLDGNEKLLKLFAYPSNNHIFYGLELNLLNRNIIKQCHSTKNIL